MSNRIGSKLSELFLSYLILTAAHCVYGFSISGVQCNGTILDGQLAECYPLQLHYVTYELTCPCHVRIIVRSYGKNSISSASAIKFKLLIHGSDHHQLQPS